MGNTALIILSTLGYMTMIFGGFVLLVMLIFGPYDLYKKHKANKRGIEMDRVLLNIINGKLTALLNRVPDNRACDD